MCWTLSGSLITTKMRRIWDESSTRWRNCSSRSRESSWRTALYEHLHITCTHSVFITVFHTSPHVIKNHHSIRFTQWWSINYKWLISAHHLKKIFVGFYGLQWLIDRKLALNLSPLNNPICCPWMKSRPAHSVQKLFHTCTRHIMEEKTITRSVSCRP